MINLFFLKIFEIFFKIVNFNFFFIKYFKYFSNNYNNKFFNQNILIKMRFFFQFWSLD